MCFFSPSTIQTSATFSVSSIFKKFFYFYFIKTVDAVLDPILWINVQRKPYYLGSHQKNTQEKVCDPIDCAGPGNSSKRTLFAGLIM